MRAPGFLIGIVCAYSLFFGFYVQAATVGMTLVFSIDPSFDFSDQEELQAVLVQETSQVYFYTEQVWWSSLDGVAQSGFRNSMQLLAFEFERTIHPNLTSAYGPEWNPGVDGDPKITILVHRMKKGVAGYFREIDGHLKLELPNSNEKEMVYIATDIIQTPLAKSVLAHEFTHAITFNQKERLRKIKEETWLDEARAEYSPTLLGYSNVFAGSNLEKRLKTFVQDPGNPLAGWEGEEQDYGAASLFAHYVVDHYGVGVLTDSMRSERAGVAALEEGLKNNGFETSFRQVFTDWTIALFLNDCSYGKTYCYLNQNLENLKLAPALNFLPVVGKSTLQIRNSVENWSPNWMKFLGGQGVLQLSFQGSSGLVFAVPYLTEQADGRYHIRFLEFTREQESTVFIPQFGKEVRSLVVIPSLQSKVVGFGSNEPSYPFSLSVSMLERTPQEEAALIEQLMEQIALLKKEIARVQAQLSALTGKTYCGAFASDLRIGMKNSPEVGCLQEFLKSQGGKIYPEGLVTSNFGFLTHNAVVRFQEKYSEEILAPLGLKNGTGYVGAKTREKIQELSL